MISERERLLAHMDKHSASQLFTRAWFDQMRELYQDLKCINGMDPVKELTEIVYGDLIAYADKPVTKEELIMVVEWIML